MNKKLEKIISKLPQKLRITSKVSYELLYLLEFNDNKTLGECRPNEKQIVVVSGQPTTELTKTYIHELLHALSFEYNINLTEAQVQKLEVAIYNFLRLNKVFDLLSKLI